MPCLNRRRFLQGSAGLYIAGRASAATESCTAYLGFGDESSGGIQVYSVRGSSWRRIQTIPARRPSSLLLAPDQRSLFAANDVSDYDGLPRGTVESFRIREADGRLQRVSTVGLSLSATRPRHLVSTSNSIVVAAHGGGSYNVLDLATGGHLSRPKHIFKEVGCGLCADCQASAHPHSMVLHDDGHIIATDFGSDRLSVFELQDGRLRKASSIETRAGDGPGPIVLNPDRSLIFVLNLLSGSIAVYPYAAGSHSLGKELDRWYIPHTGQKRNIGSLFLDETNNRVIASLSCSGESTLAFWSTRDRGVVKRLRPGGIHELGRCLSTGSLLGLDQVRGRVLLFDDSFGFEQVAKAEMPLSLAMRSGYRDQVG